MWYKIVRCGKTDSYPYEDAAHFISEDGVHWEQDRTEREFPKKLIEEAFSYRLHKRECKTWTIEVIE